MIYITESPNDSDLATALGSLAVRAPIPHGDAVFFGKSEGNSNARICIERKKLHDIAACMTDGRYVSQAQSAKEAGFDYLILIVEGIMRPGRRDGLVEVPRGSGWSTMIPDTAYSRLDQYLTEIDLLLGIPVKRSASVTETASIVKALWQWFQKPPEEHQSLKKIYTAPYQGGALLTKPSLIRRIARELPGIGWERSAAVDERFGSVVDMVTADENQWKSVSGIGKKTAQQVVAAMRAMRS